LRGDLSESFSFSLPIIIPSKLRADVSSGASFVGSFEAAVPKIKALQLKTKISNLSLAEVLFRVLCLVSNGTSSKLQESTALMFV
jgi:hypothetical protein